MLKKGFPNDPLQRELEAAHKTLDDLGIPYPAGCTLAERISLTVNRIKQKYQLKLNTVRICATALNESLDRFGQ